MRRFVLQQLLEVVNTYIENSKFLGSPAVKAFAKCLVSNQLGPLASRRGGVLVDLTIHLAAVLLCGNQGIVVPLQQLVLAPHNMQVQYKVSCFP